MLSHSFSHCGPLARSVYLRCAMAYHDINKAIHNFAACVVYEHTNAMECELWPHKIAYHATVHEKAKQSSALTVPSTDSHCTTHSICTSMMMMMNKGPHSFGFYGMKSFNVVNFLFLHIKLIHPVSAKVLRSFNVLAVG